MVVMCVVVDGGVCQVWFIGEGGQVVCDLCCVGYVYMGSGFQYVFEYY